MKWEGGEGSSNVEDQRGLGKTGAAVGGVGAIVVILLALLLGKDPKPLLDKLGQGQGQEQVEGDVKPKDETPEEKRQVEFVSKILRSTEIVWTKQFRAMGKEYREPKLVLFRGSTQSACGFAESAMGPFYCPGDEKVRIDLSFFTELETRFKAPGDFARAYVIAHEVGHHVQHLLGDSARVDAKRGTALENEFSVRLELQADFYAGLWAYHADKERRMIESGDVEKALDAARAIGDDTLQKQTRGRVVPDSFTHGSSEQRVRWFKKGLQTGDIKQGDTFKLPYNQL